MSHFVREIWSGRQDLNLRPPVNTRLGVIEKITPAWLERVAEYTGHSRPSITADTYSHLQVPATEKAARLLDEALA